MASLLKEFGLESIRTRYPHQLSSGQAQRVAFARALAMEPAVLLLDEPTAKLDLSGRHSVNFALRRLLTEYGLIVIYVTHDIFDRVALATHLMVLKQGKVIQAGMLTAMLDKPADAYVAEHLGIINLWPAEIVHGTSSPIRIRIGGQEFSCTRQPVPDAPVFAGIGPGEVELFTSAPRDSTNCVQVVVQTLQISGRTAWLELAGGPEGLRASIPPALGDDLEAGQILWIRLPADRLRLIPACSQ